jgi:glycosyltransferase involved in cell wall biosynthesis
MRTESQNVIVVIPAYNEENAVGKVVQAIPKQWVREIVVVNNNSNDQTPVVAKEAGATVVEQPLQGYGNACLKGLAYVATLSEPPEIILFLDADYSDYPEEAPLLIAPILDGEVDMVIGSRNLGKREKGAMTPQQIFGNWLATTLIKWMYGVKYTDLGPFRAIRYEALCQIDMQDKTYGWTVEMQVKAAKLGVRAKEVAVSYRNRIGHSKISGTIKGTVLAGYKIITTIIKYK